MAQAVEPRGAQSSSHQSTMGRDDFDDSGHVQELSPCRFFELTPKRIGVSQQRHVRRMFEVAQAYDACFAVGRAAVIPRGITIQADDAHAAACQMISRRTTHGTKAADRDIEVGHGWAVRLATRTVPAEILGMNRWGTAALNFAPFHPTLRYHDWNKTFAVGRPP